MAAASWSSFGMARKNGRMMTIEIGNANAACGIATPSGLLSRCGLSQDDEQRQDGHGHREQQPEREKV